MSLFSKFDLAAQPTKTFIINHPQTQSCMNIPCVPQFLCDLWTQLLNMSHASTTAPTQLVFLMLQHFLKLSSQEMVFVIRASSSPCSPYPHHRIPEQLNRCPNVQNYSRNSTNCLLFPIKVRRITSCPLQFERNVPMNRTHPYLCFIYTQTQFILKTGNGLHTPDLNQDKLVVKSMTSRVQQSWKSNFDSTTNYVLSGNSFSLFRASIF